MVLTENRKFSPTEEKMWNKTSSTKLHSVADSEINAKYEKGEQRILTEMNREKLPSFADSLKRSDYMDIRPFYQRRERWSPEMQSKLIESFLINIPVPPIILYERDYNSYEVIDGQQRITTIQDFYNNKLKLEGLDLWSELNGRTYDKLPGKIKSGIDRRSISSIVLITESTSDQEEAFFLKQLAFERFNTGGVKLSNQEVRNCIFYSNFNQLIVGLSENKAFKKAWGIPTEDTEDYHKKIKENDFYKKMNDVELILRFFALRHTDNLKGNLKGFLDDYMRKSINFSSEDIHFLKVIFVDTIELAHQIYAEHLFQPFDAQKSQWKSKAYKAYYDAVMVGFSNHLAKKDILLTKKAKVIQETKNLFHNSTSSKLFTGQGNRKTDIQKRISLFDEMLTQVIQG
jgi:hypothetical protein